MRSLSRLICCSFRSCAATRFAHPVRLSLPASFLFPSHICVVVNGIVGMGGLLRSTALTAEQREYVESIELSSNHLLVVINDILDFSKIESGSFSPLRLSPLVFLFAGKLKLEMQPFDLFACVEQAIELSFRPQL